MTLTGVDRPEHYRMLRHVVPPASSPVMTRGRETVRHEPKAPHDTPSTSAAMATVPAWVTRPAHHHRASLARIARPEGLAPEDAFDAVQEAFHTFLTLPQACSLVDEPDQSRKLLAVLTRNVARNRRRLHAVARPHESDRPAVDAPPRRRPQRRPAPRAPSSTSGSPAACAPCPRSIAPW